MSTYETVQYEQEGSVVTITMDRPNTRNALNRDLERDLHQALAQVRDDASVRAIVLTGAGKGFCSGADLASFGGLLTADQVYHHLVEVYGVLVRLIVSIEKPVLAAVNGVAAGAGCSLALACDLRVMADDASMLQAFSNIGLVPDAGSTWLLARQIGYSRAYEMAISGERLSAEKCLALGLTNRIAASAQLLAETQAWAQLLSQRPTLALGLTKKAMHHALEHTLTEAIEFEAQMQRQCVESEDHREGVMAFLEKRAPTFKGR